MEQPSRILRMEPPARATVSNSDRERTWFHSPLIDLAVVYGGGACIAAYFFWASRTGAGLMVGAIVFGMFLDMPHVMTTSARVLTDRDEFAIHGKRYLISTVLILAATITAAMVGAIGEAVVVWAVWQFFHVVKQHIGMMILYAAKGRYKGSRRPIKGFLAFSALAPALVRAHEGLRFGHYSVNGHELPFSRIEVPAPNPPLFLAGLCYAAAVACAVALVVDAHRARREGGPLPGHVVLGLLFVAASYNLAYLTVDDLLALIVIATATHALQYHVINWRRLVGDSLYERRRGAEASPPAVVRFGLIIVAAGVITSALESTALYAISIGFVLQHFYMDRYLWRSTTNPRLAQQLGLK